MLRLSHFLSQQGITSRRKAEELIAAGKVSVNGKVIREQGTKVDPGKDRVSVSGRGAIHCTRHQTQLILFHKPRNVMVTKHDSEGRPTIFDYLKDLPPNFNPVGRLDFDSEGLILLTNDGALHQRLAHPSFEVSKIYEVKVSVGAQLIAPLLGKLKTGVQLSDGPAKFDQVSVIKENPHNVWLRLVLHEGRNRIIRRMCEAVGLKVLRLKRVAVGPYQLKDIPVGKWQLGQIALGPMALASSKLGNLPPKKSF